MRRSIFGLFIAALTVSPAVALAGHGGGGGNQKPNLGTLHVTNQCDDAVAVTVNGGTATPLEPGASIDQTFFVLKGDSVTPSVTASLVSDPTVTTSAQCSVTQGKTTKVSITSSSSGGQIVLSITSKSPGNASLSREARVMFCSMGVLSILLWLGTRLGRCPRPTGVVS
jgi:hypothetical protein